LEFAKVEWLPVHCETNRPAAACSFRSAQAATLLEFHVPLTNCFVCRWICVVRGLKPLLHCHNWLSFGKFQDTESFLLPCPRHVSSQLPRSGETCKYATAPRTPKNLERFSTYWCAALRHDHPGYCTAEVRNPGGTYELPYILWCMIKYRDMSCWLQLFSCLVCTAVLNLLLSSWYKLKISPLSHIFILCWF
jgi:hypothetical protein